MKKSLFILVLMMVGCFLAGCSHAPTYFRDPRVMLDSNLGSSASVTSLRSVKTESGMTTFQVSVANNGSAVNRIEYRVQWLDAQGFEIESVVSTWHNLALQPYETRGVKITAPSPQAVDFRFYMKKMD